MRKRNIWNLKTLRVDEEKAKQTNKQTNKKPKTKKPIKVSQNGTELLTAIQRNMKNEEWYKGKEKNSNTKETKKT